TSYFNPYIPAPRSSPCQDILLWFLEKAERGSAVAALVGLSGMDASLSPLLPYCQIQPASLGGAVITVQVPPSDEDEEEDALYEKVSGEQWRMQCLVELLSLSPSRGLAADFFLFCLKVT
ncbi:hypothetical protein FKM82_028647, partial [Ascaphus truei]